MQHRSNHGPRPHAFQPPQGELALLAGSANKILSQRVADELGVRLTPCEAHYFSEGNVFVRILENVRGRDCYIIQGTHNPVNDNFMELLFWIDALKRASAQQVTAVVPFFSYAKGDKKDEPRVSIRARVCADAIEAAGADRCLMMDLHTPQIQGFFHIPVDHLYARYVLCEHIRTLNIPDLVVCSPDVGFAKNASAYADYLGAPLVIGNKVRRDHSEQAQVLELVGDVQGKNVLIVDDFTISGGTLIAMADVLKARGANDIYAAVSHGALSKGVAPKFGASQIKQLFITDTIEPQNDPLTHNITVVSVSRLFAEAIQSIHDRTSVSQLFPDSNNPEI
ncbi:ribose-phosphate diphosphokinase [Planctomicrobium piriforme]|uniref:ribose-phosphate diphosphokinase n=1 Tax=Planctomicrobium piriforme TaxID=1576369 RepID=A0A1I3L6U0_9PLAN|nr:ribose-phosphate diphosphokinase [Planctomicrobium piriforme]SFI80388.1 ribose-phosphate pyrophosphokinase [Planctomicrobium piriforme]